MRTVHPLFRGDTEMIQFGMPTLVENAGLDENLTLCKRLGLRFVELNMNFPEYQVDRLEQRCLFFCLNLRAIARP